MKPQGHIKPMPYTRNTWRLLRHIKRTLRRTDNLEQAITLRNRIGDLTDQIRRQTIRGNEQE